MTSAVGPARFSGPLGGSRGGPHAIPRRQRLVVEVAAVPGRFARRAIRLRDRAHVALAFAATATPPATTASAPAAAPRPAIIVAVAFPGRFPPSPTFVIADGFAGQPGGFRRFPERLLPPRKRPVEGVAASGLARSAGGGLFVVEPVRRRAVTALLAAATSAASATAPTPTTTALALFVIAGGTRRAVGLALIAKCRINAIVRGSLFAGKLRVLRVLAPTFVAWRPGGLAPPRRIERFATLLRSRFGGRPAGTKRELVLLPFPPADRRRHFRPGDGRGGRLRRGRLLPAG